MTFHPAQLISLLLVGVMLALRLSRMRAPRPLRLEQLWIVPAILLGVVIVVFARTPPTRAGLLWAAVALAGGAALGWWRGAMMRIAINPATHALNVTASPAAILFLVGMVALRLGARLFLVGHRANGAAMIITEAAMVFAFALFSAQRLEMYLRGRRMLAR